MPRDVAIVFSIEARLEQICQDGHSAAAIKYPHLSPPTSELPPFRHRVKRPPRRPETKLYAPVYDASFECTRINIRREHQISVKESGRGVEVKPLSTGMLTYLTVHTGGSLQPRAGGELLSYIDSVSPRECLCSEPRCSHPSRRGEVSVFAYGAAATNTAAAHPQTMGGGVAHSVGDSDWGSGAVTFASAACSAQRTASCRLR